jgi:hypothetical protein
MEPLGVKKMSRSLDRDAFNPINQLRWFLVLDMFVRIMLWQSSACLSLALFSHFKAWPQESIANVTLGTAWIWAEKFTFLVITFNVIFLVLLIALRLLIPTPKEGRYEIGPKARLSRPLLYSALIATLTKARYGAPFPGFLLFHIANLPPICWLMSPIFGPKSSSCYITEPGIVDPHLVSIGRNVVIGMGAFISGHYQESNAVVIGRTVIEDDVLIGANAILAGVRVRRGAKIGAGSVVLPGSVIGPDEYWSGNPARRRGKSSNENQGEPVGDDAKMNL